jgi:hypothetical protein
MGYSYSHCPLLRTSWLLYPLSSTSVLVVAGALGPVDAEARREGRGRGQLSWAVQQGSQQAVSY